MVTTYDCLTQTGQKHFHLGGVVLQLTSNIRKAVRGFAHAHKGQKGNLNTRHFPFRVSSLPPAFHPRHHKAAANKVDFLFHIAGQISQTLACFDGWTCENKAFNLAADQFADRHR